MTFLLIAAFIIYLIIPDLYRIKIKKHVPFINLELTELCQLYHTDKCADGHNFIKIYAQIFSSLRSSTHKLLEIGVLNGDSHKLWKEYFTNAQIFGMDLNDVSWLAREGIQTMVGDQSDRSDLQRFISQYGSDYDIIIDDGGHAMDQQQISLGFLFKYISPGGYYIIEDVHTSLPQFYTWDGYKADLEKENTTLQMMERFMRTGECISFYCSDEELEYLQSEIESVQLFFSNDDLHSMMCVIRKK